MINKTASVLFLSFYFWLQPVQTAIPANERDALIALYNAAGGENWTNNSILFKFPAKLNF